MPFPVDIAFVRRAESRLGMDLPASYVAAILKENGGSVDAADDSWEVHPVFDDSDTVRLKRTCNDVVHETSEARDWEDFPPNAVSIAANGVGDHLILLPDSSNAKCLGETVYLWDHETGTIVPVADAFARLR
jgi:hypothetical protein